MCCMKTNPKVARCPSQQARLPWGGRTGLQGLHSLHAVSCVPEKQATNSSTTSKAWGAAPLPAKKPHTCPVLLHLLERPVQRLQTSQPLLMFWTCWIHVIDKVFLKTTSWLKEKNNFGCLGFAQLALLAPVAVLQERVKVISTLMQLWGLLPACFTKSHEAMIRTAITQVCGKFLCPPQPTASTTCPEHSLKHKMRYKLYYITATRAASCSSRRFLWGKRCPYCTCQMFLSSLGDLSSDNNLQVRSSTMHWRDSSENHIVPAVDTMQ